VEVEDEQVESVVSQVDWKLLLIQYWNLCLRCFHIFVFMVNFCVYSQIMKEESTGAGAEAKR
jgi:hypothetical protein